MTTTLRAERISPQCVGHHINGYDIEDTYFNGPLVAGDYNKGPTINLVVGRQQYEVWLTQEINIEPKDRR